jgi:flagellar motor switch protein FliG
MTATPETSFESNAAIEQMTKLQKLAALLVMLGSESASQILRHLDEAEVEAISAEMAKVSMVERTVQTALLQEFTDVAVQASTAVRGGLEFTQGALERAVGLFKATDIINRVAPSRPPVAAVQQIAELEARQLVNLIKTEAPQTIALIVSYLPPERAARALGMLPPEQCDRVIERLATLAPTPIEVVEKVVEMIKQKLGGHTTRALTHTGGLKSTATLLNSLDKELTKKVLTQLEERNPDLGKAIRNKMFTFEDLTRLEATALQKVLREVDMRDLAVSLKTASEKLKTTLLSCISKRAAETVNEEISFLGGIKLREVEAAQLRIIEVVRRLETEGEVEITDNTEKQPDAVTA